MKQYKKHTLESLQEGCDEEGECWLWRGYMTMNNTPGVYLRRDSQTTGKMVSARALAHELHTGTEIQPGHYYRPTCGNHKCINPDHTSVHSAHEHMVNMNREMLANATASYIRARKIGKAKRKLTDEQVHLILTDSRPTSAIATEVGVSKSTVCRYRRGVYGISVDTPFGQMMARL